MCEKVSEATSGSRGKTAMIKQKRNLIPGAQICSPLYVEKVEKEMATPVFLPGESLGQRRLVGHTQSRGLQRVGHD